MVPGRIASSVLQRQVRHVAVVNPSTADGLTAQVYQQVADEMRIVVPPALLHSASPDVLAAYWAITREPLFPAGEVTRTVKEAVAAAVSVANVCPYCADMHTVGLYDLTGERDAEAIALDRLDEIGDPALRDFVAWAREAHRPDGPPLPAGVTAAQRAELVGVVVGFHYLSRMVNVFLSNFLLPPGLGPRPRRRLKQGLSRVLRPVVRGDFAPGRANRLLDPAPPRADTAWAAGSPLITDTATRTFRIFEAAGARSLDPAVRRLVLGVLDDWNGADTGLSTGWSTDLVAGLPTPQRAAGRLVLLTALASYQVDAEVVQEFRRHFPHDATLIDAGAWASFATARRIGIRHDRDGATVPSPTKDG